MTEEFWITPTRYVLPCKCVVMLDFDHGSRRVICDGDDPARPDRRCEGGRGYIVTAEIVETVFYQALPMMVGEAS